MQERLRLLVILISRKIKKYDINRKVVVTKIKSVFVVITGDEGKK